MPNTVSFSAEEIQSFVDLLYPVPDEHEANETATDAHRKYGSELKEVAAEMLMRARAA